MLKRLAIAVTILLAILPVHGQKERGQSSRHQGDLKSQESPPPSPAISIGVVEQAAAEQKRDRPDNHPKSYFSRLFSPESLPNIGLLIAGIIGIFFANRSLNAIQDQARLMKRQADLMEDTAKRQLRAYIGLTETCVKFTDDGGLEAQMFFKNAGQTPAYDVRSWVYPMVDPYPLTYVLPPPPVEMPRAVGIIPSQEAQILVAPPLRLPQAIIDRLSERNYAFYAIGEVNYKDIFGDRHILKYRLVFGGRAGARTKKDSNGVKIGMLCMDVEGNEEEDEPRYRYPRQKPN